MEALRPLAAKKLGIQNQDVQIPYDLVTVMPLDVLWKNIAHQLDVLTMEVQYIITGTYHMLLVECKNKNKNLRWLN